MIKKHTSRETETREAMRGGSGKVTIRHYFKPEELKARTRLCAELIIPSGASIGVHEHIDEDELYIVQKGSGLITDGGKESVISGGDAVVTGQGTSHSIRNTGPEDLVITAIIIKY